jgi:hypothetical protein
MWSQRYSNFAGRDQRPDARWVARVQRSDNPEAGCHLSGPKPELKAWLHSGLFNAICITLGGVTLLNHFLELFEVLTIVENRRKTAFVSP